MSAESVCTCTKEDFSGYSYSPSSNKPLLSYLSTGIHYFFWGKPGSTIMYYVSQWSLHLMYIPSMHRQFLQTWYSNISFSFTLVSTTIFSSLWLSFLLFWCLLTKQQVYFHNCTWCMNKSHSFYNNIKQTCSQKKRKKEN